MSEGLILEGVTGAGKTQTLEALLRLSPCSGWRLVREDEILGSVMEELKNPALDDEARWERLDGVLQKLSSSLAPFILERFHPTYFALMPDKELFERVDERIAEFDCKAVLLTYPESQLAARGLDRPERAGSGWTEGMIQYYGGRDPTLEAIRISQERRRDCLGLSRLLALEIDSSERRWDNYAKTIAEFLGS